MEYRDQNKLKSNSQVDHGTPSYQGTVYRAQFLFREDNFLH
jgi:hypothetical protein